MAIEVITREDLNEFRSLLLNDLKEIIQSKPQQTKQWLKSNEVRKLLNISRVRYFFWGLSKKFFHSKEKELNIYHTSLIGSKEFYFGIK